MKKFIVAILFVTLSSFGQNKLRFGVQTGLTYSKFRGNETPVTIQKFGFDFMAGISLEYVLNEKFSLKTNFNYDRKTGIIKSQYTYRSSYDNPSMFVNQKVINNSNYLTIPILVKYSFGNQNSFFINAGPYLGFLLNSKLKDISNDTPSYFDKSQDTTDLDKKTDFGVSYGIGRSIPLNEKNDLIIELRHNLGLSNTSDVIVYNNGEIKTNSFNLIVGWSLGI